MISTPVGLWILKNTICQLFCFKTSRDWSSVKTLVFSTFKAYLLKKFSWFLQILEWKEHLKGPYCNLIYNHRTASTILLTFSACKMQVKWRTRWPIVTFLRARRPTCIFQPFEYLLLWWDIYTGWYIGVHRPQWPSFGSTLNDRAGETSARLWQNSARLWVGTHFARDGGVRWSIYKSLIVSWMIWVKNRCHKNFEQKLIRNGLSSNHCSIANFSGSLLLWQSHLVRLLSLHGWLVELTSIPVKSAMTSAGPHHQQSDQSSCECDRLQEFLFGRITLDSSTNSCCHVSMTSIWAFHSSITYWSKWLDH